MWIRFLFPLKNLKFYPLSNFWQILSVDGENLYEEKLFIEVRSTDKLSWKKSSTDLIQELLLLKDEFWPFFRNCNRSREIVNSKHVQPYKNSNTINIKEIVNLRLIPFEWRFLPLFVDTERIFQNSNCQQDEIFKSINN